MLYGLVGGSLVGIPLILFWYFARRRAARTLNWPSTPGRVIESKLISVRDTDGDKSTQAEVRYTYEVAGATLTGGTIALGGGGRPSQVVAKYPVGSNVEVFYDPNKPTRAVLERGGEGLNSLLIAGIAVIAVAAVFGIIRGPGSGADTQSSEKYNQAMSLYSAGKYSEAEPEFQRLARQGMKNAQVYLGVMYAKGQGVKQDFIEAEKWFILAGEPAAKNREALRKGLTPEQEQEAKNRAASWQAADRR